MTLCLVTLGTVAGCRTIARHAQSQPTIAARKLSRQGLEAMHQGRWDRAETLFSDALEMSQADDRAHWGYAETLWQRGDREKALEHMEQAVRLSAHDPEAVVRLGQMYFEVGRVAEAGRQASTALRTNRSLASAWALDGKVLAASGRGEEALASFHQALALQPDDAEVLLAAAQQYASWGRHDRVLATLDRLQDCTAQEGCPLQASLLRGVALQELGRHDEASRAFAVAAQQDADNVDLLSRWARAEMEQGDTVAARVTLAKALRLQPQHPEALRLAAEMERVSAERLAREAGYVSPR